MDYVDGLLWRRRRREGCGLVGWLVAFVVVEHLFLPRDWDFEDAVLSHLI